MKTLERCFDKKIDREMSNIVDTVEDRIQNAILIAIDSLITPNIELVIMSKNASSGREANSVMASSEHGEHIGITAPSENVSERNNTLHVLNVNDDTQNIFPDEVSELSIPGTHFDRQPHTHHTNPDYIFFPVSKINVQIVILLVKCRKRFGELFSLSVCLVFRILKIKVSKLNVSVSLFVHRTG